MLTSNSTFPNNSRRVEGTSSQPNDNSNDLLSIEPSVLQGRVQFRRPSLLRTIHETYSQDEYDRTSIKVKRRKLALPERGDRIYFHDNTSNSDNPSAISELDDLAAQCRQLSIADGTVQDQDSRVRLMPSPHHPNTGVTNPMDSAEDDAVPDRPLPLQLRRPATPLPPLFLEDSENEGENEDESGCRSSYESDVASPLTDVSGSDESDGCLSPPPHSPSIGTFMLETQNQLIPNSYERTRPLSCRQRRPLLLQVQPFSSIYV